MTNHVFAIYDSKAEAYLSPFPATTYGLGERMFSDMVNSPGHQFNRHPEDYTLYVVGKFDTHTGQLGSIEHTVVITGLQAIQAQPDTPQIAVS